MGRLEQNEWRVSHLSIRRIQGIYQFIEPNLSSEQFIEQ